MSLEFVLASIVVVLVPGTGVVYTITTSLNGGAARGVAAAIGCTLGIVPHLVAASLLVSGVLDAVPGFVDSMRWLGAGYLAWLGIQLIRHGAFTAPEADAAADPGPGTTGPGHAGPAAGTVLAPTDGAAVGPDRARRSLSPGVATAVRGVLLNVLNPKLLLFFLAFLPQFVGPDAGAFDATLLLLSGSFMAMTFVGFCAYAFGASMLADSLLRSDRAGRRVTRVLGGSMVALGLQLAVAA